MPVGPHEHSAPRTDLVQLSPRAIRDGVGVYVHAVSFDVIDCGAGLRFAIRVGQEDKRSTEQVEDRTNGPVIGNPEVRGSGTRLGVGFVGVNLIRWSGGQGFGGHDRRRVVSDSERECVDPSGRASRAETCRAGAHRDRSSFGLVAVEEAGRGGSTNYRRQFPGQVVYVGESTVHAESSEWSRRLRGVPGQEDATFDEFRFMAEHMPEHRRPATSSGTDPT